MKSWLAWVTGLSAATLAFAADAARQPTAEFLALPRSEQNLAVYDAFWQAIRTQYYDAALATSAEWQSLRDDWRMRAAGMPSSEALYREVFAGITAQLPESHLSAEPPSRPLGAPDPTIGRLPALRVEHVLRLAGSGTGHDWTEVRRGGRKFWLVNEVLPGSPAAAAGIRPGWRVVSADTAVDEVNDVVRFMGEFVPLETEAAHVWERGAVPNRMPDPAEVIRVSFEQRRLRARPRVELRMLADRVRYLRFDVFGNDRTMSQVFAAMNEADDGGLILDLRWNAGGLIEQLQKVAGALLGGSVPIGTFHNSLGIQPLVALDSRGRYRGPLVLLIGPGSASSAEMLAAAIQEHRRGSLVGRMTNGSALFSRLFPLPDGGWVLVPVSDFRTADNQRLEGVGVIPDVRVMPTLEDVRVGRDVAVERALAVMRHHRTGGAP